MSNERKPLLSDEAMDRLYPQAARVGPDRVEPFDELAEAIRDWYEQLITDGKLRAVEDVDVEWDDGGIGKCACGQLFLIEYDLDCKYCPGCGNKIKNT